MYFEEYLQNLNSQKDMAQNSIAAYKGDLNDFFAYMKRRDRAQLEEVTGTDIVSYLKFLKDEEKSIATINRRLASIRNYYDFLIEKKAIGNNPAKGIKSPNVERKQIEYLSKEEIERLLALPIDTKKQIRNRAIIEMMYATGLRAKEIVEVKMDDVNISIGFVACSAKEGKARIVPIGKPAKKAINDYVEFVRKFIAKEGEKTLFLNSNGKKMTRQGLWKILKECGNDAKLTKDMTPNILRNSFAIHMLQNGADLKTMQELLGHEDLTSTQIYEEFVRTKIKDVYDNSHPRA